MSPQKRTGSEHTPIITGYKDEGDKENNRTLQNDEEYVKYKPGVGWLGFMVSGVFNTNRKPVNRLWNFPLRCIVTNEFLLIS